MRVRRGNRNATAVLEQEGIGKYETISQASFKKQAICPQRCAFVLEPIGGIYICNV
jgi:hypothetical protein